MTAKQIFKEWEYNNKWLEELTEEEKKCITSMLDEALQEGFEQGLYEGDNR